MSGPTLRVAYAGTPEFAAVALQAIAGAGFELCLVLTQPDRPAGRGLKLSPSAVKQVAQDLGVPVVQPRSLRLDGKYPEDAAAAQLALQAAAPDVLVVAAYGLILPAWVLQLPRLGCLNIHGSLLPRWRGAAPIHRAIEAGDAQTGITIMQMDEGLDTGDMLLTAAQAIRPDHTTGQLHDELAAMGAALVVESLRGLVHGGLTPARQPVEGVCYAHKIDKSEGQLDWRWPAEVIERRVRAFDPFPGLSFQCAGEAIKLWKSELVQGLHGTPGQVLEAQGDRLVVACGVGALALQRIQRPGGRRVPVAALTQSLPDLTGQQLPLPPSTG